MTRPLRSEPLRPAGPLEAVPEDGKRRLGPRERALIIIFTVLVVLGGAYFLMTKTGSKGSEAIAPTSPATAGPAPKASSSPAPNAAAAQAPVRTAEFFEGRDPFEPLVQAPPPAAAPGAAPGAGGVAPDAGPDGGVQGKRVSLLDIYKKNGKLFALVAVNGTEYTVTQGQEFAENFRVNVLTSQCGSFSYGDEGFTLCLGQEVVK